MSRVPGAGVPTWPSGTSISTLPGEPLVRLPVSSVWASSAPFAFDTPSPKPTAPRRSICARAKYVVPFSVQYIVQLIPVPSCGVLPSRVLTVRITRSRVPSGLRTRSPRVRSSCGIWSPVSGSAALPEGLVHTGSQAVASGGAGTAGGGTSCTGAVRPSMSRMRLVRFGLPKPLT